MTTKRSGQHFGRFFSQTHLVTLIHVDLCKRGCDQEVGDALRERHRVSEIVFKSHV
jgi:hypothetical protein